MFCSYCMCYVFFDIFRMPVKQSRSQKIKIKDKNAEKAKISKSVSVVAGVTDIVTDKMMMKK